MSRAAACAVHLREHLWPRGFHDGLIDRRRGEYLRQLQPGVSAGLALSPEIDPSLALIAAILARGSAFAPIAWRVLSVRPGLPGCPLRAADAATAVWALAIGEMVVAAERASSEALEV